VSVCLGIEGGGKMSKEAVNKMMYLIAQNPDLPIKASVASETVASCEKPWWIGDIIDARIDQYVLYEDDVYHFSSDFEYLKDQHENVRIDDTDCKKLTEKELDRLMVREVMAWPWKKAIFVRVEPSLE